MHSNGSHLFVPKQLNGNFCNTKWSELEALTKGVLGTEAGLLSTLLKTITASLS